MAETGRELSNNVQQRGLMNEVQDISSKGWDLMSTVFQKAKEQIVGAGIPFFVKPTMLLLQITR